MTLNTKRIVIGALSATFLASLLFVQFMEVARKRQEAGLAPPHIVVPASSKDCVECHDKASRGITDQWRGSRHAEKGVGCLDCHKADQADPDAFSHYGQTIATVVTPRDCSRCHPAETDEFTASHHAKAGNILASLDNYIAENVEGGRMMFNPHSPTPGKPQFGKVDGYASAESGCWQCHGGKVGLLATDGPPVNFEELKPGPDGKPTNPAALARIRHDKDGRPLLDPATWPNTGIGRLNLDGSRGSCSACHSRHDFSRRRAREPENCGKCHLGPDHPQKEIYDESKHGIAYYDKKDEMNLSSVSWVLGVDYTAAPTCATCHMSGNTRNGGKVTHDPGERISWTNRPPISLVMDTDRDHKVITEADPQKRAALIADSWENKRNRMRDVCKHCHSDNTVDSFYTQYDSLVQLFNEKFAKPGKAIMDALKAQGLVTKPEFDEKVEWTWYYLWHHEGRRARHGAAMNAPDYTHWHGMYEVADRFYNEYIPEVREITKAAREAGKVDQAAAVDAVVDEILRRPEHQWFEKDKPKVALAAPEPVDAKAEAKGASRDAKPTKVVK